MKIRNFTALVCMLFVAQLSFGQITLEKTYKDVSIVYKEFGGKAYKYMVSNKETKTITIYNLDHSVYKTIKIEILNGANLGTINYLYTNVINSDPLLELYYVVQYNDSDNTKYEAYIINENNELIKKIDDAYAISIISSESGFKLFTYINLNNMITYNIYSLPTSQSDIPLQISESHSLPYPNPAKQTITIPYQLSGQWGTISIYNASGQFVEQKNVDKNFSNLLLDVSSYAKGMYYYKVDKQKGEFMVN